MCKTWCFIPSKREKKVILADSWSLFILVCVYSSFRSKLFISWTEYWFKTEQQQTKMKKIQYNSVSIQSIFVVVTWIFFTFCLFVVVVVIAHFYSERIKNHFILIYYPQYFLLFYMKE